MPDVIVDYDLSRRTVSIVHQEEVQCDSFPCKPSSSDDAKKLICPLASEKIDTGVLEFEMNRCKDVSDLYCCERKEVTSHAGVKVPLTILYSKEAWRQGQSPGLLHVYGAYGEVLDISWCPNRLTLLDRGWLLAFADVR